MEKLESIRKLGKLAKIVAKEIARKKGKPYDNGEEYTRIVIRKLPRQSLIYLNFSDIQKIFNSISKELLEKNLLENQEIKKLWTEVSENLLKEEGKIKEAWQLDIAFQFTV